MGGLIHLASSKRSVKRLILKRKDIHDLSILTKEANLSMEIWKRTLKKKLSRTSKPPPTATNPMALQNTITNTICNGLISTEFLAPGRLCGGARVSHDLHVLPCLLFRTVDFLLSSSPLQPMYPPPVPSASGAALLRPSAIPSPVLYLLSLPSCSCPEFFCYIYYLPHFPASCTF